MKILISPLVQNYLVNASRTDILADVLSAFTMVTIVVPQAIAYALLAGLPAQYGLYTSILPVIVYAFLGTSRHLSVGTFALISIALRVNVAEIIGGFYRFNSEEEVPLDLLVSISLAVTVFVGVVKLLFSLFRFGRFATAYLLPPSLISALTASAAFHIATSQLPSFFGLNLRSRNAFFGTVFLGIFDVVRNLIDVDLPTLAISLLTLVSILLMRRVNYFLARMTSAPADMEESVAVEDEDEDEDEDFKSLGSAADAPLLQQQETVAVPAPAPKPKFELPSILIAIFIATVTAVVLNKYADAHVKDIHFIPSGLPSVYFPFSVDVLCNPAYLSAGQSCTVLDVMTRLIFPAIKLFLISSMLSFATLLYYAKEFDYLDSISLDRDLFALGLANVLGPFVGQSFLCGSSLSRTALSVNSGAKSLLVSVITTVLIVIVLYSLTGVLKFIPLASLAAVILMACYSLASKVRDLPKLLRNRCTQPFDLGLWIMTFLGTILFDVDIGLLVGVSLCIVRLLVTTVRKRYSKTRTAILVNP